MNYPRSVEKFKENSFLFGPRGTGKSTWLMEKYPEAVYIDLLSSESYRYYSARPERVLDLPKDYPDKQTFIIDEVQRIPELLSNVHKIMEMHKKMQFILTGSSSRKLKRGGVDLLAGRAIIKHLHPLLAAEMSAEFNLDTALVNGMVPLIVSSSSPTQTRRSYIDLYLNEEVKEEGLTRNVGNFARFLETMSFSQGSVLNLSDISRDSEVKRNTVDSYVSILEDLLIAVRIPVFTRRAKRALISSRKFYFFDCGVFQGLRPAGPLDDVSCLHGIALETLVMQHLRAWIDYSGKRIGLYFWRTRGGSEVDFVLYGEDTFVAIEVKNTKNPRGRDVSGLKTFWKDYPEVTSVLLYRGSEKKKRDGVFWLPVDEFLKGLRPEGDIASLVRLEQ